MAINPFASVALGNSPVLVSRLGLGTLPLANFHRVVSDSEAADIVSHAVDIGIRYIDTAPDYGFGLAEERVGAALRTRARSSWVLSTKVGRLLRSDAPPDPGHFVGGKPIFVETPPVNPVFDFSYEATLTSLEESLDRLGLDRVDVVFIHDPDDHFREALEGAYRALERLRADGRVLAIGVGMNQARMLVDFAREGDFDCFLVAGKYTLLDQGALKELMPLCQRRGIGLILGGAFNTGILANAQADRGDLASGATFEHGPVPDPVMSRVRAIQSICHRHGVPLKAAAAQFPFGHPAVSSVLIGVRSPDELDEDVRLLRRTIPGELWQELRHEGFLDVDAAIPS